jgi:LTXXQ motif family protein
MSSRVKFMVAATTAAVAVGSIAWLGAAAAFDGGSGASSPQLAQATTPPAAPPPAAGGGPAGAGPDRPAMPRMMQNVSPRDMCLERVARRIGNRAYLKARLDLKPEQVPLWSAFEKAADDASARDKAGCAALPAEANARTAPNFMERFNRRDEMMKARVESMEAVKPSLQALYAALTPEQKAILDRPAMGGHQPHRRG